MGQNICTLYREYLLYGVSVLERFHCICLLVTCASKTFYSFTNDRNNTSQFFFNLNTLSNQRFVGHQFLSDKNFITDSNFPIFVRQITSKKFAESYHGGGILCKIRWGWSLPAFFISLCKWYKHIISPSGSTLYIN